MKQTVKYQADNGALFDAPEECAAYEKALLVGRDGWKDVNEVTHLTLYNPDYNKQLLFLVRDARDADAVAAWCDEREIFFPGVHEYPTILVISCRDGMQGPIDPKQLPRCRTSGELETLETYIGRTAFEMTIQAGELFHTDVK